MTKHHITKGTKIRSKKHSPIWIDIGEVFEVIGFTTSPSGNTGVKFIDRNGGERVFWGEDEYEVIESTE